MCAVVLRTILESLGHEVTIATTGTEAWDFVRTGEWRLVITDWIMPGMDGLELCRRIRAREGRPYTYIVMLTCMDSRSDRIKGLTAGADDFLTKPVDPEELAVRLQIASRIIGVQDELMAIRDEVAKSSSKLAELAATDWLTGVANRRCFADALRSAASFASRHRAPLSVMMLDLDHFKSYNDEFGHPAGDDAIRTLAAIIRENIRDYDLVARYGGEEFAVLLPTTNARSAVLMAERLRMAVASHDWTLRPVTSSIGVATSTISTFDGDELVKQADSALYRSKTRGRNRVTHASGSSAVFNIEDLPFVMATSLGAE